MGNIVMQFLNFSLSKKKLRPRIELHPQFVNPIIKTYCNRYFNPQLGVVGKR